MSANVIAPTEQVVGNTSQIAGQPAVLEFEKTPNIFPFPPEAYVIDGIVKPLSVREPVQSIIVSPYCNPFTIISF